MPRTTIVLVHGAFAESASWNDVAAELADTGHRVIAFATPLRSIAGEFAPAVLASSLSAEDMVLTHAIARARLPIGIFVLDTGRLNQETLSLVGEIESQYGLKVAVFKPDEKAVAQYVSAHGRDAFYGSVELRKRCCEIRKVEPLGRALAGKRAALMIRDRALRHLL